MKKLLAVFFLGLLFVGNSPAQNKNIVQLQIHPLNRWYFGTPSGNFELDYERYIGAKNSWSFRIGIHPYFANYTFDYVMYLVPISFQKIFWADKSNQLELGLGAAERFEPFQGKISHFRYFPMIHIMYRKNIKEKLVFRGGITGYVTWGGAISPSVGLGYRF